jgi:hypothetical protein
MPKKTPGKLLPPPAAAEFDELPLARWCKPAAGVFYRLHSTDLTTSKPWPSVFFSQRDRSRFDPAGGPGTLYLGASLAGAMLEIFDDHWGPVGSPNRTITQSELDTWWVTLIAVPETVVLETAGSSLSKIGTDMQLLSGDHASAREWALRLSAHPATVGGIAYVSRHDHTRGNLALFQRPHLLPIAFDAALLRGAAKTWQRAARHGSGLVHGPAVNLRDHADLMDALSELEVGLAP